MIYRIVGDLENAFSQLDDPMIFSRIIEDYKKYFLQVLTCLDAKTLYEKTVRETVDDDIYYYYYSNCLLIFNIILYVQYVVMVQ